MTVETPFDFRQKNVALIQMENQYQIPRKGDFCRIAGKHVKPSLPYTAGLETGNSKNLFH